MGERAAVHSFARGVSSKFQLPQDNVDHCRPSARRYAGGMGKADLDTVLARRAAIATELAALEKLRADMEKEVEDLDVAERVLKRLAGLSQSHHVHAGQA